MPYWLLKKKVEPSRALLREYLDRDAPRRERSIAIWMVAVSVSSALVCLALSVNIGWRLSLLLASLLGVIAAYYSALRRMLVENRYHWSVPWINALIEVSIPALIFVIDCKMQSAEFALTAPVLMIWGSLIALNGLRSNRLLAISAGIVAAVEYLALYLLVALPMLPVDVPETLKPAMILTRAFLLICAGVITAIISDHLTYKAESALGAVRERDWMGRYLIHERIGTGGMAEVFRATYSPDGGFEKRVALKRVLPTLARDPEFVSMFRAEAELGSWLSHPNIVQVFDLGSHNQDIYLAMEFIDGATLTRLIECNPDGLPPYVVAYVALGVAKALDYTHTFRRGGQCLGLIHSDVNPPNILISQQAEVKLSDFGIVRAAESDSGVATDRDVSGKFAYLAPEQINRGSIDGRADLYSLGLTMYESLTGRLAVASEAAVEAAPTVYLGEVHRPPQGWAQGTCDPRISNPGVPTELAQLVIKLLERDPSDRYATAAQVVAALYALPDTCAPSQRAESALAELVQTRVRMDT